MEKYQIMQHIESMKFRAQLMLEFIESIEDLPAYAEQLQMYGAESNLAVSAMVGEDAVEWADPSSLQ